MVGALSLAWLVLNPGVQAQWSTDPSENTWISWSGQTHQIISDGNGGAHIAWIDGRTGFDSTPGLLLGVEVYMQHIDENDEESL